MFRSIFAKVIACIAFAAIPLSAPSAQGLDPRSSLSTLIQAFSYCGPAWAFQLLGVQAYQTIFQQTGGTGCFPNVLNLGPVANMQIVGQVNYPAGPVYNIRVTHQSGLDSYWTVGIGNFTQKVEYITVASIGSPPPPLIPPGPVPAPGNVPPPPPLDINKEAGKKDSGKDAQKRNEAANGCILYPAMCPDG